MFNKYIYIFFLFLYFFGKAQIGVGTKTPQADLHVEGNLQITKDLNVGGTDQSLGNSGNLGEYLMSQGANVSPTWKKIDDVVIAAYPIGFLSQTTIPTEANLAKTTTIVVFDNQVSVRSGYVDYNNSTGEFTILKEGFYRVYASLILDASKSKVTAGEARTAIYRNSDIVLAKSSVHHEITNVVSHNLYGLVYFKIGDKMTLTGTRSVDYILRGASLSILYSGS